MKSFFKLIFGVKLFPYRSIVFNFPVMHPDNAPGVFGRIGFVRYQNHRVALFFA